MKKNQTMNQLNNNKKITIEEIVVPMRLSEFIVKQIDKEAFTRWQSKLGCINEVQNSPKAIIIKLNADNEEQIKTIREQIFDVLKRTENAINGPEMAIKEIEVVVNFFIILRLLIPNQKCGYVSGRQGSTLKKIETDCEVQACFDKGKYEPVPEGFGRLILKGSKIEGLRAARSEIQHLIDTAMEINPFGPAIGRKAAGLQNEEKENEMYRERIKVPLYKTFNVDQRNQFKIIQETAGINFSVDQTEKPLDSRFIILEGEFEKVINAKSRIAKLVAELKRQNSGTNLDMKLSSRECVKFPVPFPIYKEVIGAGGEVIKKLKQQLDVSLIFEGDNFKEYPDGRMLSIVGYSSEKVQSAKEYIEREFINRKRQTTYYNDSTLRAGDVQMEMVVPSAVSSKMLKVKIKSHISSYERKSASNRPDGTSQILIIIRGSQDAVQKACSILDKLTIEFLNGNPKWENVADLDNPMENHIMDKFFAKSTTKAAEPEPITKMPISPFLSTDDEEEKQKTSNAIQESVANSDGKQQQHGSDDTDDKELEQALTGLSIRKEGSNRSESPEIIMNEDEDTDCNNNNKPESEGMPDVGFDIDEAFKLAMEARIDDEMEMEGRQTDDANTEINDNDCFENTKNQQIEEQQIRFTRRIVAMIQEEQARFTQRITAMIQEEQARFTEQIIEKIEEEFTMNNN